ncbi:hypothetical protein D918_07825 [Trichuris suis]|nr:hypothetical protein D918_07825 [Trichuris suis]
MHEQGGAYAFSGANRKPIATLRTVPTVPTVLMISCKLIGAREEAKKQTSSKELSCCVNRMLSVGFLRITTWAA